MSIEWATATMVLFLPLLTISRRYCAARWVFFVREAAHARYRAQSSKLAPEKPTASPAVRHHENLSCALAARDWTMPARDAAYLTSSQHLPASGTSLSSIVLMHPRAVSSIAKWIPSPLPRLAVRSATGKVVVTARGCFRTSVAQTGIPHRLRRQPQPRPASFYVHRFRLSYTP